MNKPYKLPTNILIIMLYTAHCVETVTYGMRWEYVPLSINQRGGFTGWGGTIDSRRRAESYSGGQWRWGILKGGYRMGVHTGWGAVHSSLFLLAILAGYQLVCNNIVTNILIPGAEQG